MKCRSCKMNLASGWDTCPNCGLATDPKAAQKSAAEEKSYKKLINFFLLAGIVLYIVLKLRS